MKRALFIGRWQPLHPGHKWLFNKKLEQQIPILIAVRDTPVDDSNPFTTDDVITNLEKEYLEEVRKGMVKIIPIPDIESVNYGRGVGYEINEYVPPKDIGKISATKIREALKNDE
ncbi:MAG: cytidyltransferase [Candidatus Poseidoniales archaeon]